MPIIFPFTTTSATVAVILFFVGLIYCAITALYLESKKDERHRVLRISLIIVAFICLYCEYCAVNIGLTLNPPKKANIQCVEK